MISFDTLTRAQHAVMDALAESNEPWSALHFKPATLGALCGHGLVDVRSGMVSSNCVFLWNMAYHPEKTAGISDACMDEVQDALKQGKRITAIKALRTHTGLDLKDSIAWMDHHFPR